MKTTPFTVKETLQGTEFCAVTARHWQELKPEVLKDCRYGTLHVVECNPLVLTVYNENVCPGSMRALAKGLVLLGECDRFEIEYQGFLTNYTVLLSSFDFSEEGIASLLFEGMSGLAAANEMFRNIVLSGKRLINGMESSLKSLLGKDSKQYEEWKNLAALYYDESIPYSPCYDIRNCIEHGDSVLVSLVNVDIRRKVSGFAINLENDIFDTSLKAATKDKLRQFLKERKESGLSPWLSLVRVVKTYRMQVGYLYALFLTYLTDKAIEVSEDAALEFDALSPINCVVRDMPGIHPDDLKPARRVYRIDPPAPILHYQESVDAAMEASNEVNKQICRRSGA